MNILSVLVTGFVRLRLWMVSKATARADEAESQAANDLAAAQFDGTTEQHATAAKKGGNGGWVAVAQLSELLPRIERYQAARDRHKRAVLRMSNRVARRNRYAAALKRLKTPRPRTWAVATAVAATDTLLGLTAWQWFGQDAVRLIESWL